VTQGPGEKGGVAEAISVVNLSKRYGTLPAVQDLTLSVGPGEFFGFLGPNGAGKTTTIRMLTGSLPPDRGSMRISGLEPGERTEILRRLGVMPESRGFYDWMTGAEYLGFFAALYRLTPIERRARVEALLNQTELMPNRNKRVGAYSRGMKQRLGLARALINNPTILILDEPTLGLDPQGQVLIQNLLRKLNSSGVTVFYSSHLLHEVSTLCSRIGILNQGRLVALGTIPEILKSTGSPSLTGAFLSLTGAT
jgi:ABC-type multidrug transport system ATPase subunit